LFFAVYLLKTRDNAHDDDDDDDDLPTEVGLLALVRISPRPSASNPPLSKLLTYMYCVLRPTHPATLSRTGNE